MNDLILMGIFVAFRGNVAALAALMRMKESCPVATEIYPLYEDLLEDMDELLESDGITIAGAPPGREQVVTFMRRFDKIREKTMFNTMSCPNPLCPEREEAVEMLSEIRKNNLVRQYEYTMFAREGFAFYDRAKNN